MSILQAALEYAEYGWKVLPLHSLQPLNGDCTCRLGPKCSSPGKHPKTPNGVKDATSERARIDEWFSGGEESVHLRANLGIATGRESSLVVLDVDTRHGGGDSLRVLEYLSGETLSGTRTVQTGSGGWHYYYRHPGHGVPNSAGALGSGLDVRGDGGYVVAPPSLHASGSLYSWVDRSVEISPLPVSLGSQVKPSKKARPPEAWGNLLNGPIGDGKRNVTLAQIAGKLHRTGLEEPVVLALLHAVNDARCSPPLDEYEVEAVVASIGFCESRRRGV